MKITIDLGGLAGLQNEALSTPSVPIPPPELLKRAKALGAISAGPSNFGRASVTAAMVDLSPSTSSNPVSKPRAATKRKTRKSP